MEELIYSIGVLWVPRNLSHHMDRQARTGETALVNNREMTGRAQTLPWRADGWGEEG